MSIEIVGAEVIVRRFENVGPRAADALERSIVILVLKLKRYVAQRKLTGQVLKVRTGTLRRSIMDGGKVLRNDQTVVGVVNTNVKYGALHEYGGTVSVPEHLRLVREAFGKALKFPVWATVKTHSVTYPERSFMRTALSEMKDEIVKDMTDAVKAVV